MPTPKSIEFTPPIHTAIKQGHRDDGTPKAGCVLLGPITWTDGPLRYTVTPFVDDDGKIVQYCTVTPVETSTATDEVLAHFAAGSVEPKPKPDSKGKSKGTAAVG